MYALELTTAHEITEKQKDVLQEAVKAADPSAECSISGASCKISGRSMEQEKLSYLMGIAMGWNSSNEIVKLLLSYEK